MWSEYTCILLGLAMAAPAPLRFSVVSIRPSAPGQTFTAGNSLGTDRFSMNCVTAHRLIEIGYHLYDYQIEGGPRWVTSEHFDILARADAPANLEQMEEMVRGILTDRFHLQPVLGKRETTLLELGVSKEGAKLRALTAREAHRNFRPGYVTGSKAGLEFLVGALTFQLGKTVVDKTGLKGEFDYDLSWTPGLPMEGEMDVSLESALREQLGLRLQTRKGPVQFLNVEKIEKPTGN